MADATSSKPLEFHHDTEPTDWALSPDRVLVFSVFRPNPEHAEWLERKAVHDAARTEAESIADPFAEPEPERHIRIDYTMPAKPNAGLALAYLKRARQNADEAASWLLETAIGSDGYDALVDELAAESDPDAAAAIMRDVITKVAQRALGGAAGKR